MAHRKRRAGRRGPAPYQQGDLDGLCGVYAIVNAMRVLHPKLGRAGAEALFAALVQAPSQGRKGVGANIICSGLSTRHLRYLIGVGRRHLREGHGVDIRCESLVKGARQSHRMRQTSWLWSALTRQLERGAVAIVGLGARHNHWTVVVDMTSRTLWLADSGGMQAVRRSVCEREQIVQAREVFILSRHAPPPKGSTRQHGRRRVAKPR